MALGDKNWIFGKNCRIQFDGSGNPTFKAGAAINTDEASLIVNNPSTGAILFYGGANNTSTYNNQQTTLWTVNNTVMPNGVGLQGDASTSQSIAIPDPGNSNRYYVFTPSTTPSTAAAGASLKYSVVDITLNGGLGDVISGFKDIVMPGTSVGNTEKVTAYKHANGTDFWVISGIANDIRGVFVYLVTAAGISSGVSYQFSSSAVPVSSRGQLKVSPDGKYIASCEMGKGSINIYSFNSSTGNVSLNTTYTVSNNVYSLEFSPDSKLIYYTVYGQSLRQFSIQNPGGTDIVISNNGERSLQLNSFGKIYAIRYSIGRDIATTKTFSVINNPNNVGSACNYVLDSYNFKASVEYPSGAEDVTPRSNSTLPQFPGYITNPVTTYTVTITNSANNASTNGSTTVNQGSNYSTVLNANAGYYILGVTINGVAQTIPARTIQYNVNLTNIQANQTVVTTTTAIPTYTVTLQNNVNITPSSDSAVVNDNSNYTKTITANSGYKITRVVINGVDAYNNSFGTASYNIAINNIAANQTIIVTTVASSPTSYNITLQTNNNITPASFVESTPTGQNYIKNIVANSGYKIIKVTIDSGVVYTNSIGVSNYTISIPNVQGNHTVTIETKVLQSYNIVVNNANNSSTNNGGVYQEGSNYTVGFTANPNYQIDSYTVNGSTTIVNSSSATFSVTGVDRTYTITVNTSLIQYTVDVVGSNITATPVTQQVSYGGNSTTSIVAATGFEITTININSTTEFSGNAKSHTVNITNIVNDKHIFVTTQTVSQYTVTITNTPNTHSEAGDVITIDANQDYTNRIIAAIGYRIDKINLNGVDIANTGSNLATFDLSFLNIQEDKNIVVTSSTYVPSLTVETFTITEGTTTINEHYFNVSRTGNLTSPSSFNWSLQPITSSLLADDFRNGEFPKGTIVFPANSSMQGTEVQKIIFNVNPDTVAESDEQYKIVLSNLSNITSSSLEFTGIIKDDDLSAYSSIKADFYINALYVIIGQPITLVNTSFGDITNYFWDFADASVIQQTDLKNPEPVIFTTEGVKKITLTVRDDFESNSKTVTVFVGTGFIPVIVRNQNVLTTNIAFTSYQWKFNGYVLPGETDEFLTARMTGYYSVTVKDSTGAIFELSPVYIKFGCTQSNATNYDIEALLDDGTCIFSTGDNLVFKAKQMLLNLASLYSSSIEGGDTCRNLEEKIVKLQLILGSLVDTEDCLSAAQVVLLKEEVKLLDILCEDYTDNVININKKYIIPEIIDNTVDYNVTPIVQNSPAVITTERGIPLITENGDKIFKENGN